MTILLVDSDKRALDREAQRLSTRQSGIVVVLHSSAADAEKFAMHHDVDIVYVREKLDEMSGQELVRRILRFRPTAECHVLGPEEDIPFAGASCGNGTHLKPKQTNLIPPRRRIQWLERWSTEWKQSPWGVTTPLRKQKGKGIYL